MDVVFIVGKSNSGKSTQVRSLTGKGQDSHAHPNAGANILDLDWGGPSPEKTLVLAGSLNEGWNYDPQKNSYTDAGVSTVHPTHLHQFLSDYQGFGAKSAILCISTTVNAQSWRITDYETAVTQPNFIAHRVIHCIDLDILHHASGYFLPSPNHNISGAHRPPRNSIAATMRPLIGII